MNPLNNFDEKKPRDVAAAVSVLLGIAADDADPFHLRGTTLFGNTEHNDGYAIGNISVALGTYLANSPVIKAAAKASILAKALGLPAPDRSPTDMMIKVAVTVGFHWGRLAEADREKIQAMYDEERERLPEFDPDYDEKSYNDE